MPCDGHIFMMNALSALFVGISNFGSDALEPKSVQQVIKDKDIATLQEMVEECCELSDDKYNNALILCAKGHFSRVYNFYSA